MFGKAIDYGRVRIIRRKWAFFQPRETVMAPCGNIHFHPAGSRWRADFAFGDFADQGLFLHEMTHVWQAQKGGRFYLPLMRHPFCRYRFELIPGKRFRDYGIEQQAEIVRTRFLADRGMALANPAPADLLPFA